MPACQDRFAASVWRSPRRAESTSFSFRSFLNSSLSLRRASSFLIRTSCAVTQSKRRFFALAKFRVLSCCAWYLVRQEIQEDDVEEFQKRVEEYKEQAKCGRNSNAAEAFRASFLGLIARYERKYWLARPAMLILVNIL